MKKTHQVVMFPAKGKDTKEPTQGSFDGLVKCFASASTFLIGSLEVLESPYDGYVKSMWEPQHLCFISDDVPEIGDWALELTSDNRLLCAPFKVDAKVFKFAASQCKKIVASDAMLLTPLNNRSVASIPKHFLRKYRNHYRVGTPITEVDLEMTNIEEETGQIGHSDAELELYVKTEKNGNVVFYKEPIQYLYPKEGEEINIKFIPVEQAIALKQLGFNEICWAWYNTRDQDVRFCYSEERSPFRHSDEDWVAKCDNKKPENICMPTFEQAFDWFEKYHELAAVYYTRSWSENEPIRWSAAIEELDSPGTSIDIEDGRQDDPYPTKDEAKLAILKRMIVIVTEEPHIRKRFSATNKT